MRNLVRLAQSPRNLVAFEAAARTGSFTAAAQELSIQQPSVSAAIKQLEDALGTQLFLREHRKVTLTSAGETLFASVRRNLSEIEDTLLQISRNSRDSYVTLNASSAFTFYWMMPRMAAMRANLPGVDFRLQNSAQEPDLDVENISLGVRLGDGKWPSLKSARLADEVIFPVASPLVMASAKTLRSLPNLMHEKLIHLEEPLRKRPSWSQWFAHHKIANAQLKGGLRLNDYALVIQAALNGEGIAFGWEHIVRGMVDGGQLAAREEWAWRTGNGIYLVWPEKRPLSSDAQAIRDWIIDAASHNQVS